MYTIPTNKKEKGMRTHFTKEKYNNSRTGLALIPEGQETCPTSHSKTNAKPKMIVRGLSLVVGPMLVGWCLYALRNSAVQMSHVMEQMSQSTPMAEAARNHGDGTPYASSGTDSKMNDFYDGAMDDSIVMDEEEEEEEGSETTRRINDDPSKTFLTDTFYRTKVRQSRHTRHFNNQDDFRYTNNCPTTNFQQQEQQQEHHDDRFLLETTLVTQLHADRLWLAKEICARWKDPIVIVVYFDDENAHHNTAESSAQELRTRCQNVHLLFFVNDDGGGEDGSGSSHDKNFAPYPINLLRNLALEAVRTSHVLLIDDDFLPSSDLSTEIHNALQSRQDARRELKIREEQRDALVVASFQMEIQEESQQLQLPQNLKGAIQPIPSTFEGLQRCVNTTVCSVFQERDNPEGHSSTRTRRWLRKDWYEELSSPTNDSIRNIRHLPCMASHRYAPYMVLPWCPIKPVAQRPERIAPLYDERFLDHKTSTIQYVEHLRHLTYDFMVVPKGFLVHAPSAPLKERLLSTSFESNNDNDIFARFKEEVHQKFGERLILPRCSAEQLSELEQESAPVDNRSDDKVVAEYSDETDNERFGKTSTPHVQLFEFFNTSSSELVVLRLSDLEKERIIRNLSNQDEYRHVTSCPANIPNDRIDITLVTHLDFGRHKLIKETCDRWNGPFVAVVYFSEENEYIAEASSLREFFETNCRDAELLYVINDLGGETLYPINLLRNLAMEGARTSHVLLTDADFLPSEDLAEEITAALRIRKEARKDLGIFTASLDALVVPAFQVEPKEKSGLEALIKQPGQRFVPRHFEGLQECINKTLCSVFGNKKGAMGHISTRTHSWLKEEWYEELPVSSGASVKNIRHVPCMDSPWYEPYIVLPWCRTGQSKPERIAPLYDERFSGYGLNKQQYIEHVRHAGYDFMTVPKGFLVHLPHLHSSERMAWDANQDSLRSKNNALWKQFQEEIHNKIGRKPRFQRCTAEQLTELAREWGGTDLSDEQTQLLERSHLVIDGQVKIQQVNSSLLKATLRMTEIQETRTIRTFWNQDDFRSDTSCSVDFQHDEIRTTLVTQLSTQRLWLAKEICSRWKDPIFMVVYFPDERSYADIGAGFLQDMDSECPHVELLFIVNDAGEDTLYPINLLRNLALGGVRTSHVLMHDADFLPSKDLSREISSALQIRAQARVSLGIPRESRDALVVPAFQFEFQEKSEQEAFIQKPSKMSHRIPHDFDSLKDCINTTTCLVFHENHYPQGHSSTRTHLWLQQEWYDDVETPNDTKVRDINHVFCMDSEFYEPYFVLSWCGPGRERLSPIYDERFEGYGMNKNQYFEHIRHFPHDFLIVPKGFLIHAPHSFSAERIAWDRNSDWLRSDNKRKFTEIGNEIHQRFGYESVKLKSCEWLEKQRAEKKNLRRVRQ